MKKHLIKRHSRRGSYDLFSTFDHFMPDVKDMVWMVLLFFVGLMIGVAIISALGSFMPADFATKYGVVIAYPLQFIPMMLYASAKSRFNEGSVEKVPLDSNDFGNRKGWSMALIVSTMAVATAFVIEPVSMLLPEMSSETKRVMEMLMNGPIWIVLLSVSVFAPFFEEWLCRGIILRGLLKKVGPTWAIVISAAVFGLIHGNIWQAIPAFLIGCILGYVYYKTGSLKLTMLMHCVNNTLAVVCGKIPGLKDVEFFAEIMSPWAYILVLAAFAVTLVSGLVTIASAKSSESSLPTSNNVIS